jgi:hypothetical protein
VAALAAELVPSLAARRVAALAMCAWCFIAAASVGLFLVPCAVALVLAARSRV